MTFDFKEWKRKKRADPEYRRKEADRDNARKRVRRKENPEFIRAKDKITYKKHKDKWKWRSRFRHYGITKNAWEGLFASQGSCCAACGSKTPRSNKFDWHTDHDHNTGKIRGILCVPCNRALGYAEEDIKRLQGLAAYLERNQ